MKIWSVFSVVILLHFVVIGLLLIQPGCQSGSPQPPDPAVTQPSLQPVQATPMASPRRELDPAFNAGIETGTTPPSGRRLSTPRRPDTPSVRTTSGPDTGLLQPVREPVADSLTLAPVDRRYTVARGDTLSGIARREGVPLSLLLSANGLDRSSTIYVGQTLLIPETEAAEDTASVEMEHAGSEVTVRRGDTLSAIASRNGTTVNVLKSLNNLRRDTIYVGQKLRVPDTGTVPSDVSRPAPARPPVSNEGSYTVRSGDTLSGIARRFGTTTRELMALNNIDDPRRLFVGRNLIIPGNTGGSSPEMATQAPPRETRPVLQPPNRPATERVSDTAPDVVEEVEDPMSALEALEDDDLPFVEVEAVDEESDPGN